MTFSRTELSDHIWRRSTGWHWLARRNAGIFTANSRLLGTYVYAAFTNDSNEYLYINNLWLRVNFWRGLVLRGWSLYWIYRLWTIIFYNVFSSNLKVLVESFPRRGVNLNVSGHFHVCETVFWRQSVSLIPIKKCYYFSTYLKYFWFLNLFVNPDSPFISAILRLRNHVNLLVISANTYQNGVFDCTLSVC